MTWLSEILAGEKQKFRGSASPALHRALLAAFQRFGRVLAPASGGSVSPKLGEETPAERQQRLAALLRRKRSELLL